MTTGDPAVPEPADDPDVSDITRGAITGSTIIVERSQVADAEADEISRYVGEVEALLSDLDREELDDLIHDLELHLREIRAEADEPFTAVIGSPQEFATELRQSAGFGSAPPAPAAGPGPVARMEARVASFVQAKLDGVRAHTWGRAILEFLPELRPGWWVLRGYLLALAVGWMTSESPLGLLGIPRFGGSVVAGLVATALLIVLSVRWGRHRYDGWLKQTAVRMAGAVAVITALVAANTLAAAGYADDYYISDIDTAPFVESDWTTPPANIYAYLPDGTPLYQVLLFNEAGDPVDLPESGFSERLDLPFEAVPVEIDGRTVANLYPRELRAPVSDEGSIDDGQLVDEGLGIEDSWPIVPAPTVGPPFMTNATTKTPPSSSNHPSTTTTGPATSTTGTASAVPTVGTDDAGGS
jgi:hypothetical protein